MSDTTAQLELRFGVTAEPETFAVEADSRDAHLNKPINVNTVYSWHLFQPWSQDELYDYFKDQEVLKVLDNGYTHVRVYAPLDYDVELLTTDPPVGIAGKDTFKWIGTVPAYAWNLRTYVNVGETPTIFGGPPPEVTPPTWEYVGVYEDIVHDTITFSNQRIAYMKYNYVKQGFEVAFASKFLKADGSFAEPPVWYPALNGAFVASEPVTGGMVLRYPVKYRLYKVNYGMAGGTQWPRIQMAWLNGDIKQFPIPPVLVMAMSPFRGRAAQTTFEKDVYPQGAQPPNVGKKKDDLNNPKGDQLTETTRVEEEVIVADPSNPAQTITVKRAKEVTLQDKSGRTFTWKLKG